MLTYHFKTSVFSKSNVNELMLTLVPNELILFMNMLPRFWKTNVNIATLNLYFLVVQFSTTPFFSPLLPLFPLHHSPLVQALEPIHQQPHIIQQFPMLYNQNATIDHWQPQSIQLRVILHYRSWSPTIPL